MHLYPSDCLTPARINRSVQPEHRTVRPVGCELCPGPEKVHDEVNHQRTNDSP